MMAYVFTIRPEGQRSDRQCAPGVPFLIQPPCRSPGRLVAERAVIPGCHLILIPAPGQNQRSRVGDRPPSRHPPQLVAGLGNAGRFFCCSWMRTASVTASASATAAPPAPPCPTGADATRLALPSSPSAGTSAPRGVAAAYPARIVCAPVPGCPTAPASRRHCGRLTSRLTCRPSSLRLLRLVKAPHRRQIVA